MPDEKVGASEEEKWQAMMMSARGACKIIGVEFKEPDYLNWKVGSDYHRGLWREVSRKNPIPQEKGAEIEPEGVFEMTNRIKASIDRIKEKLETVTPEKQVELEKALKATQEELSEYQKLQSAAFACGKLSLEEAQSLYQMYGGESASSEGWERLSLAEKVVATQTAGELAKMNLCNIL